MMMVMCLLAFDAMAKADENHKESQYLFPTPVKRNTKAVQASNVRPFIAKQVSIASFPVVRL
jgi:hypothetical protein